MVAHPPVVLGLDFGGTKVAVAVCDRHGNRLASATLSTASAPGKPGVTHAQAVFERTVATARGLLATAAAGRELAAVGVATFGIPYDDRVELAPAIAGWEDLALGRELRAAFGLPAAMATDAKAAAAAEARWGALQGCDPGVYLNLGTGLSAAMVAHGQVITGGNGAAGEFGYNLRAVADVNRELSQRTMLEEMVSGLALARRASGRPGYPTSLTAADVFAAPADDPELGPLAADFTRELAFHLVNLAILVNPVRIAAGGGMVRAWDRIGPPLAAALRAGAPFPPELVPGRFPYDAPLLGAVALAVDAAGLRDPAGAGPDGASAPPEPETTEVTQIPDITGVTDKTLRSNTGVTA